eukprot:TRINITY_DN1866_c1_g1_i1.p2 TRINITY_DN1866_c1_g1~~TRINITY_DN1866_c1_g1_i1.p2  ORF type:complete len:130 (-),score=21.90 TRINITY_DN1866_c1_g1_i1:522-911(-)
MLFDVQIASCRDRRTHRVPPTERSTTREPSERSPRGFQKDEEPNYLNVGGKRFSTSKSTLTSIEDTYFHAMLSSDKWKPNEDGEYFIDRNPKHFQRIIDYMKDGRLFNDLNRQEKEEIVKETRYQSQNH